MCGAFLRKETRTVSRPARSAGDAFRRVWNASLPDGRRRAGFTLLELMTVIVVISILTVVILPEMKGTFEDMLLRSTSRTLVSAFALASSQAVTVHRPHRVRLDPENGGYAIEREAGQTDRARGFIPVDNIPGGKGQLDKRIKIQVHPLNEQPGDQAEPLEGDKPKDLLAFYPDGTAEPCQIVLRDRDGFGLVLRINSTTARVRVIELPRE